MVRGSVFALTLALAWVCCVKGSVLVPTYVLPPDSFVRDQRSLGAAPADTETSESQRTIRRLIGGHIKIKPQKEYGDPAKNSFAYDEKSDSGKFSSAIAPNQPGGTVGWNQGIWDDGMLMSSAGEGKETGKGDKEDDEEKKTLLDQVAEGKYGLIQNEIFVKEPKRPGIVSYDVNPETRNKDNVHNLGGLKKELIWLAEDHLLVLKGGSFPESNKDNDRRPWPPIDNYEAPRRQVKLPQKPIVPPPFPVRLHDDGPLVFLTPKGSVPAPLFPPFPPGESDGSVPFAPFPFPPGTPDNEGGNKGNSTAGGAPFSIPPFPFLPGNASEGPPFPFPLSINGSFPEGFPPGAAFLPPPSNQSDLYDEDDPSIYYPPPYNFSYHVEKPNVPAGPLVPGIILPPPPDFFAPLEEKSTTTEYAAPERTTTTTTTTSTKATQKPTYKRPTTVTVHRKPHKTRPTTTESTRTTEPPYTVTTSVPVEIVTTPKVRQPTRVVQIPHRNSLRGHVPVELQTSPKPERPNYSTRHKLTSKPLSVSVIYDYPEQNYNTNDPGTSEKPYIYNIPDNTPNLIQDNIVTSTPVPLRAYYTNTQSNQVPTTKLQPVYNRPKENALASFYFFDEQPKTTPAPITYFDGRNYYKTVPIQTQSNANTQSGYTPSVDVEYGSIDQGDSLFFWPQKQGSKTLTQEYFSIQKPKAQQIYIPQKLRPDPFYQQIADIQQTIDFYTTKRPKQHRSPTYKPKAVTSRPVYQFSYQSKPRPEHLSFRAPKLDPEPFRPMVSYSKPFNIENDFNAISPSPAYNQQYLIENVKVTTETPTSSRYYPKTKSIEEDYVDAPVIKDVRNHSHLKNKNHIPVHDDKNAPVVHINNHRKHPSTTSNPISHGYYTKQDERYFDDITKNSFDIFGKKIEDNTHDVNGAAVTPPLGTVRTPINNGINLQYAYDIIDTQSPNAPTLEGDTLVNDRHPRPTINPDSEPIAPQVQTHSELVLQPKPPSLADDTLVNDRLPRPTINPDSEFIPIPNPAYRNAQYKVQTQVQRPQYTGEQYDLNQPSLAGDTAVNYKRPLPPVNPNAEWISPVNAAGEGRPGSFVSYRLPGEGAHVYFLTPQAAQGSRERFNTYRPPPGYGR